MGVDSAQGLMPATHHFKVFLDMLQPCARHPLLHFTMTLF